MLDVLPHKICRDTFSKTLIDFHHPGKIFPSSRSRKLFAVNRCLHLVETVVSKFQIRKDRRVHVFFVCVFPPGLIVRLYEDLFDTVQGDNVELADRFVVFRRVSCCHDHPSLRNLMVSETLALEKLQHRRSQCLRNTVDLINKKDSLAETRLTHTVINTCNDLAHRIFCRRVFPAAVFLLRNKRKSDRTLSGVVCDRVRHQCHAAFTRRLLHDLRLSDSRCTKEKHRPLMNARDHIFSILVFHKIRFDRIHNFLFCLFNIHNNLLSSLVPVYPE